MTTQFGVGKMPTREEILVHLKTTKISLRDTLDELRLLDLCYTLWCAGYRSGVQDLSQALGKGEKEAN